MHERPRRPVRTASSTYLVDLDEGRAALRGPLRRDAERLRLFGLARNPSG